MSTSRDVEGRLKRSAKTRPVIVLTGARQTGKTSTFRHQFPDYAFASLDLPTEAEQAEKEPERFLQRYPAPVIADQVQYAPSLFRHLKVAVDAHRTRNGQFLFSRSQKFTLMKNLSELLAGRADMVELETRSFAEIRGALPKTELERAIVRGGCPFCRGGQASLVCPHETYLAAPAPAPSCRFSNRSASTSLTRKKLPCLAFAGKLIASFTLSQCTQSRVCTPSYLARGAR